MVIVCEPKYYMVQDWDSKMTLYSKTTELNSYEIKGIVLEVIEPAAYAGMVFTVHHDGIIATGDAVNSLWLGKWYEFRADPKHIGQFRFGPCSIDRIREVPRSASKP